MSAKEFKSLWESVAKMDSLRDKSASARKNWRGNLCPCTSAISFTHDARFKLNKYFQKGVTDF